MNTVMKRALIVLVSGGLAAGAAILYWQSRKDAGTVELVDSRVAMRDLLEGRQGSRTASGAGSSTTRVPTLEERSSLDPDQARALFASPEHKFRFDSHRFYAYRPDIDERKTWQEHPERAWTLSTNAHGFREDSDELRLDADRFVLVIGDSHVDGMCNNDESFVALAEKRLEEILPGQSVQVLNTGTSGYNFYNYLGVVDEFIEHGPDAIVVTIYGGNDYLGAVMPHHYFNESAPPPEASGYWDKIEAAKRASSAAVGMALNQAFYFQNYPDEVAFAREAALAVTEEIQRVATEAGSKLIWVYIPPLYDIDEARAEEMEAARETLALTDYDMKVADRLTDDVLAKAREHGDHVIDLRREFGGRPGPFYWRDGHINLKAQKLVAQLLAPQLAR